MQLCTPLTLTNFVMVEGPKIQEGSNFWRGGGGHNLHPSLRQGYDLIFLFEKFLSILSDLRLTRETDTKKSWVLAKIKTGQTTTQTVVFKPANDSLEKFIPRTILLAEDKFEIPVCRDDQEENCNESNLAFTCKVVSSQWPHAQL